MQLFLKVLQYEGLDKINITGYTDYFFKLGAYPPTVGCEYTPGFMNSVCVCMSRYLFVSPHPCEQTFML